ncbi:MAG: peptidylprolyl isomerase [Desulfobacterales bacterium]|jgi:peptidyl-prolyl cis-trans isomerase C
MKTKNRFFVAATLLAMIVFVAAAPAGAQKASPEKTSPDKAATVNGTVIPKQTLEREVKLFTDRMVRQGRQVPDVQVPVLRNEILDSLIDQELLYQDSQKQHMQVDKKAVDEKYDEIKKRFKTEQEFKDAIAKMDVTEAEIRSQLKKGLAIDELLKTKVVKDIQVTDEEAKKYYDEHTDQFKQAEQVKASHILIQVAPDASDEKKTEAKKKITVVQEKLKKGEDFAVVAKESSEGPSKSRGGDLGFFQRGQMDKSFEEAAFALEPGKVSEVVETRFGYHIIKVDEKKPEATLAFSDEKDKIEQFLKQQKTREKIENYLEGLRKNAKIDKFI